MENLTFVHKGQLLRNRIIGGVIIIIAIILLIVKRDSLKLIDWLESIVLLILGVLNFTPLSGSEYRIGVSEGNLKIRWREWIREVIIPDAEIEKITLSSAYVLISRKGKKTKKLFINDMKKEQKMQIYEFMIEYAKGKNIPLERQ